MTRDQLIMMSSDGPYVCMALMKCEHAFIRTVHISPIDQIRDSIMDFKERRGVSPSVIISPLVHILFLMDMTRKLRMEPGNGNLYLYGILVVENDAAFDAESLASPDFICAADAGDDLDMIAYHFNLQNEGEQE